MIVTDFRLYYSLLCSIGSEKAMKSTFQLIMMSILAIGVVACASDRREQPQAEAELFERHAGEDLTRVSYASIRGWRPVGDDAVLVELNGRRYFLLTIGPPCQRDLRFSQSLRLRTTTPRALTTFDQVGSELGWCRIERIRAFDYTAYREELRGGDSGLREQVLVEEDPVPESLPDT
ncbi:MAG: hypothetical protein EA370_05700 [Wenzhouxiangella sp.]|nr:MAG: hypothetical protein EA370_05700 [Wenzhouxiangella sp.]